MLPKLNNAKILHKQKTMQGFAEKKKEGFAEKKK